MYWVVISPVTLATDRINADPSAEANPPVPALSARFPSSDGVAVWTNDLSNKYHSYDNIPWVLAGGANGFLKTGQYIDAGNVTSNKLLNTIGSAVGCRNESGGLLDNFGDPSLEPGLISAMMV